MPKTTEEQLKDALVALRTAEAVIAALEELEGVAHARISELSIRATVAEVRLQELEHGAQQRRPWVGA